MTKCLGGAKPPDMKRQSPIEQSTEGLPLTAYPPLTLRQFQRQGGISPVTCWRLRRRGWLRTVVISGRHYVTREAIVDFNERAAAGEFAGTISNPSAARMAKPMEVAQ